MPLYHRLLERLITCIDCSWPWRSPIESLKHLQAEADAPDNEPVLKSLPKMTEFQELGELFSPRELRNVHDHSGNLLHPVVDELSPNSCLWLQSPEKEGELRPNAVQSPVPTPGGSLAGVYKM